MSNSRISAQYNNRPVQPVKVALLSNVIPAFNHITTVIFRWPETWSVALLITYT